MCVQFYNESSFFHLLFQQVATASENDERVTGGGGELYICSIALYCNSVIYNFYAIPLFYIPHHNLSSI